ncbi:hypothetical protein CEP51_013504 [Fusarium floridanum]|uniref:Uncharacterized protein n=1 Tax=Fusarium floridanum TaxID=1325733 RepID=A0A428QA57_9HYPO|nr:hypothetical protein CEP51_013504 [Fusarium floridanum]
MTSVRQSNVDRGKYRQRCREALSGHIYDKLGINVKPSEVRLNPRAPDPYAWEFLSEKEEFLRRIFAKKLSDHSINTYKLLCDEVGVTFEAVSKAPSAPNPDVGISVLRMFREKLHVENS